MDNTTLEAALRNAGRHSNREVRDAGRVPAVVYGKSNDAVSVSIDRKLLGIALHRASGRPIEMTIPGQGELHVLAREVQRHPTKHSILHVDFLAVSMTETVDTVEIECLPGDIPEHMVADLSTLETVHDEIIVSQLRPAKGVKVLSDGNQVLFSITPSRAAAMEEEAEETPEVAEVEVVKKGKKEEEED